MFGAFGKSESVRRYVAEKHFLMPTCPEGWSFCSCGAKSGPLGTFARQKEWIRFHRKQVAEMKARCK